MEKQPYFISISAETIERNKQPETEFKVLATDKEIQHLKDLMDKKRSAQRETFLRAPIPYKSADDDEATEDFSEEMIELYAYVYEIGDEQAKNHIYKMDILSKLHHTDYNHEGYESK